MNREVHVRFWEGLGVRFPWATQFAAGRVWALIWPKLGMPQSVRLNVWLGHACNRVSLIA